MISGAIVLALAGHFGYHHIYLKGQEEIRQARDVLQKAQALGGGKSQLASSLWVAEEYRKQLAPEGDVDWLVQEVGRIAQEAEVQLAAISPQRPRDIDGYTHLAVSLKFASSYHQLGHFLSRLESLPHHIRVEELEVTRADSSEQGIAIQLLLSTLYVPPLTVP
jgi:Tfp pilus assembly protein PilO